MEKFNHTTGQLLGYIQSNKTFENIQDFKKEITIDKVVEFKGEIIDDIIPNNSYLFFENGILTTIKNMTISQMQKKNNSNWCFYSYEHLNK
mgnify:CR=1 FL=1